MAVKAWSFARLLVLTVGSSLALGLGLATVGAYLAAPGDDPRQGANRRVRALGRMARIDL
jgi:hypothetical protein